MCKRQKMGREDNNAAVQAAAPVPTAWAWAWWASKAWRAASWLLRSTNNNSRQMLNQHAEHEHQNPQHDEPVHWAGRTLLFRGKARAGWACRYAVRILGVDVGLVLSSMPPPPARSGSMFEHLVRIGENNPTFWRGASHVLTRTSSPPEMCPASVLRAVAHRRMLYARLVGQPREGHAVRLTADITRWMNARLLSFVVGSPWYDVNHVISPRDIVSCMLATGQLPPAWDDAQTIELCILDGNLAEARLCCYDAVRWPID